MTQAEQLIKWAKQTNVNPFQITQLAGQRFTLVDDNPTRVYLWFNLEVFTGRVQFFPVDLLETGHLQGASAVGLNADFEFTIDRHYKLTQCQWDCIALDGPITINVVEVLYRGG